MSREIDERIVKMTFEHDQFESGIQEALSSIERLKNSLDRNMSGTQGILGNIGDGIEQIASRFSALGIAGMEVIRKLTDGALGLAKTFMDFSIGSIVTGGKNRATNINKAQFLFEGLKLSWEDAYTHINEAVTGTAYGLDEAAVAAANLAASGIKLDRNMDVALQGIAGFAASTSSGFGDVAHLWSQVAGQQRLLGNQVNQFAARGINVPNVIAEYYRSLGQEITETDIRDIISDKNANISYDEFAEAMYWKFADQAKQANRTVEGSLSNVKAAYSRIGEKFWTPLIRNLEDIDENGEIANQTYWTLASVFNALREQINAANKELTPFTDLWSRRVSSAMHTASDYIASQDFGKFIDDIMWGLEAGFWSVIKIGRWLADLFGRLHDSLSKMFPVDFLTMFDVAMLKLHDAVDTLSDGKLTNRVLPILTGIFKTLGNVFKFVASILKEIGNAFMDVFGKYNVLDGITKFVDTITRATDKLKLSEQAADNLRRTFRGLFSFFDLAGRVLGNVISLFARLIGAIFPDMAGGFLDLTGNIGDFFYWLDELAKKTGAIETAFKKVGDVLVPIFEKIGEVIGFIFGSAVDNVRTFIDKFQNGPGGLAGFIQAFLDTEYEAFTNFKNRFLNLDFSGIFTSVGDKIKTFFTTIADAIRDFNLGLADAIRSKGIIKGIFSYITEAIGSALKGTNIAKIFSTFKDYISNFLTGLVSSFDVGGIEAVAQYIADIFKSIFEKAAEIFANTGITEALEPILGGIYWFFDRLGFTDLADAIAYRLGTFFESVFELLKKYKITDGLTSLKDSIVNFINGLITSIRSGDFMGILNSIKDGLSNFVSKIADVVRSGDFTGILNSIKDGLSSFIHGLGDVFSDTEGVTSKIRNGWESFSSVLSEVFGTGDKSSPLASMLSDNPFAKAKGGKIMGVGAIRTSLTDFSETMKNTKIEFPDELKEFLLQLKDFVEQFMRYGGLFFLAFRGQGRAMVTAVESWGTNLKAAGEVISKNIGPNFAAALVNPFKIMAQGIADGMNTISNAISSKFKAESLKSFAIAIAVIVGALALLIWVSKDNPDAMFQALEVIGMVAAGLLTVLLILNNVTGVADRTNKKLTGKDGILNIFQTLGNGLSGILKSIKLDVLVVGAILFAAAVAILVGSISYLTKAVGENPEAAFQAALTILAVILVMGVVMEALGRLEDSGMALKSLGFIVMAAALWVVADAMSRLMRYPWQLYYRALGAMMIALTAMTAALMFLNRTKADAPGALMGGIGILAVAGALYLVAEAVKKLVVNEGEWTNIAKALTALLTALGIMVVLMKLLVTGQSSSLAGGAIEASVAIVLVAGSLVLVALAIETLTHLGMENVGPSLTALMVALLVMVLCMKLLVHNHSAELAIGAVQAATAILIAAMALIPMAAALAILAHQPWEHMIRAAVSLAIVLGAIAGSLTLMSALSKSAPSMIIAAASMMVVAIALLVITAAITVLSNALMANEDLADNLWLMAAMLLALAAAITLVGLVGPMAAVGAAAILIVAVAVLVMAAALLVFSQVDPQKLADATVALANAFQTLFEKIGYIFAVGAAFIVLGIGALMVSIAVLNLANAFYIVVQAIAILCEISQQSPGVIVGALIAILLAFYEALDTIKEIIISMIPAFVEIGLALIEGLLKGINDGMVHLVNIVYQGLIYFINSLAQCIRDNSDAMLAAVRNLTNAIVDMVLGVFIGLLEGFGWLTDGITQDLVDYRDQLREEGEQWAAEAEALAEKQGTATTTGYASGISSGTSSVTASTGSMLDSVQTQLFDFSATSYASGQFSSETFGLGYASGTPNQRKVISKSNDELKEEWGNSTDDIYDLGVDWSDAGNEGLASGIPVSRDIGIEKFEEYLSGASGDYSNFDYKTMMTDLGLEGVEGLELDIPLYGEAGDASIDEYYSSFTNNDSAAEVGASRLTDATYNKVMDSSEKFKTAGDTLGVQTGLGFAAASDKVAAQATAMADKATTALEGKGPAHKTIGSTNGLNYAVGVGSAADSAKKSGISVAESAKNGLDSVKGQFMSSGNGAANQYATGLASVSMYGHGSAIAQSGVNGSNSKYDAFYSAGAQSGQGVALGMLSKQDAVRAAGVVLANAANSGLVLTLQIRSPSRVTTKEGGYFGQGFINGIINKQDEAFDASRLIGQRAIAGIIYACMAISKLMDENLEVSPVITPVLNMDNLKQGLAETNDLLNLSDTVSLASNTGFGNTTMDLVSQLAKANLNQNVVDAITKLNNDVAMLGEQIQSMKVVMQSGALVGEIVQDMDEALYARQILQGRGV